MLEAGVSAQRSEAGVEAAWRIVDPALLSDEPPHEYDRGGWGPAEAERIAANVGGWVTPRTDTAT